MGGKRLLLSERATMTVAVMTANSTYNQVLTLLADPRASELDARRLDTVRHALTQAGAAAGPPDWLSEAGAVDLPYSGISEAQAEAAARAGLGGAPIDLAAQRASDRRKAALVADMDSTIVTSETLDEMAAAVGLKETVAAITTRAMNGELDFAEALRERVRLLADLPEAAVSATLERVALTEGARTLVRTMKAHGATTILVSGGFTTIAEPIGERCGFDRVIANRLLVRDGHLTGAVAEPVLAAEAKLAALRELADTHGITGADVCAVGDGANDLPMLLEAGLGVAFHAKPTVRSQARFRIDHGDLTALLYLQGYRDRELVR